LHVRPEFPQILGMLTPNHLPAAPLLLALALGLLSSASRGDGAPPSASTIESVSLAVSPLIPRAAEGEHNTLIASVDSMGLTNATLIVASANWPIPVKRPLASLAKGKQAVEIEVPRLKGPTTVNVRLETGALRREFGPFTVQPPRKWTVYLTQHTHTDIGYTRPQTEILPEHLRYIDYALDYCDLTDNLPDDARFRWTCETSWAVREYLRGRPAAQVARLKQRVREGRIEVTGMLLNMSELATENSLAELVWPVRAVSEEFGIPVRTAMQDDVNGAGWCLVDYFNGMGIRYLNMGINKTRSLLPFDKPTCFWWESPSGNRVLAYRSDHYMTGNFWGVEKGQADLIKPHVASYLASLEERRYPFDRVGVQFSGYFTDNSPPSTAACNLVKAWNEKYAWPHLRLSTAHEFLAWVEKEHASELPVHRQAWPDWWTDGFGSAARETAADRETETAMDVNQRLLAMARLLGASIHARPSQRARGILDDLLFYEEHTFGAAESISDPLAANSQIQWGEKSSYAWTAVKDSAQLREEAFGVLQDFLPRAEVPTLAVFNTLNWTRSGMVRVFIDHQILPPDHEFRILDGAQPVLAQQMEGRAEGTWWALWVKDVPPMACKILRLETTNATRTKPAPAEATEELENAFYRLTVDPAKGCIQSLRDKETGHELVDETNAWGFGQCVYETMPANREMKPEVFKRTAWHNVKVLPGANGPIWHSLRFKADLDGCAATNGAQAEVRLYDTEKRIELHFDIRKLPVPTPEAVYVTLPFHSPDGKLLYEGQGGLITPGETQIPGSASDWQTVQSFLSVRNAAGQIIVGSEQVPLVQLGDFNLGKWMPITQVNKPYVYSWVMNNYWFTNFRTEQEGEFKWHYYLTSTPDPSTAAATRFGWGSRVPLVTRVLPPAKGKALARTRSRAPLPAGGSNVIPTIAVPVPNLLVVECRPAADLKGIILHLRETAGSPATLAMKDIASTVRITRLDEVNVLEQPLHSKLNAVRFQPWKTKFVKLGTR
jgi:Glycosyl hydrolases family 38 N-terminal domain/Glycosyl hydrolases family 38 C-terminal domain